MLSNVIEICLWVWFVWPPVRSFFQCHVPDVISGLLRISYFSQDSTILIKLQGRWKIFYRYSNKAFDKYWCYLIISNALKIICIIVVDRNVLPIEYRVFTKKYFLTLTPSSVPLHYWQWCIGGLLFILFNDKTLFGI